MLQVFVLFTVKKTSKKYISPVFGALAAYLSSNVLDHIGQLKPQEPTEWNVY